jgi:hypothetical protein
MHADAIEVSSLAGKDANKSSKSLASLSKAEEADAKPLAQSQDSSLEEVKDPEANLEPLAKR